MKHSDSSVWTLRENKTTCEKTGHLCVSLVISHAFTTLVILSWSDDSWNDVELAPETNEQIKLTLSCIVYMSSFFYSILKHVHRLVRSRSFQHGDQDWKPLCWFLLRDFAVWIRDTWLQDLVIIFGLNSSGDGPCWISPLGFFIFLFFVLLLLLLSQNVRHWLTYLFSCAHAR